MSAFYKDKEVVNSGLTQALEDGDASLNIAHDEVSISLIVLTSNSSMKSTESYSVASETSVIQMNLHNLWKNNLSFSQNHCLKNKQMSKRVMSCLLRMACLMMWMEMIW